MMRRARIDLFCNDFLCLVKTDLSADARVRKLQEELENSRREVDFLNSVIVDMQRKLDELKMKLEISQATLLGQSIANEHSQYRSVTNSN